jgi:hypothetical protein
MSRSVIIVLLTIGITVQLVSLMVVRQIGSQLTTQLRIALWIKKLSMLSTLLSGGLSLVATQVETPLDIIFIASLGVWAVSTLWFWIARL